MAEANDAEVAFDGEVAHCLLDYARVHSGCNGRDGAADDVEGTYLNGDEEDTHGEVVVVEEEGHHGKARHVHDDDEGGGHEGQGCGHNSNLLYHHGNHPMASCG